VGVGELHVYGVAAVVAVVVLGLQLFAGGFVSWVCVYGGSLSVVLHVSMGE
jgi:hypothetical protein